MSDIPKHSFHITEDDIILINGIELPQRNIFEFLESGRKQMQNNEKENEKLKEELDEARAGLGEVDVINTRMLSAIDEMIYDMHGSNSIMAAYWQERTDKFREVKNDQHDQSNTGHQPAPLARI